VKARSLNMVYSMRTTLIADLNSESPSQFLLKSVRGAL